MKTHKNMPRNRRMSPAERDLLAAALSRVMANPKAILNFVDANDRRYRGATFSSEEIEGGGTITVSCFPEDRHSTRIRVMAAYSRPNLWSHIFPFTMGDQIN